MIPVNIDSSLILKGRLPYFIFLAAGSFNFGDFQTNGWLCQLGSLQPNCTEKKKVEEVRSVFVPKMTIFPKYATVKNMHIIICKMEGGYQNDPKK